jgi:hypothetical protein
MVGVVILAAVALAAVVAVTVWVLVRRRIRGTEAALAAELAGQPIVLGPARCMYLGGTGRFSMTSATSRIVLTDRRIVLRAVVGPRFTVELGDVVAVAQHASGISKARMMPNRPYLRVTTADGHFGVDLHDCAGWVEAIQARTTRMR